MTGSDRLIAEIAHVTQTYGRTTALDDVSLAIPAGRVVGLIGPDGVGKSTLLGLIAGARRIQTGDVHVFGGDMREGGFRRKVCTRIAYMPQGLGRNLYQTLSVRENVDFFGRLFGLPAEARAERIIELLESTGLAPFPDRPAEKLSGGMKQKLGLCCALIHDPDLLILDEPTTGVDPLSRKQFWELIDRIRERRPDMSILTSTAYMEEAERFDSLLALYDGAVIASGTPGELRERGGTDTLETAFISFLPDEIQSRHREVRLPPRDTDEGKTAIKAEGLTRRFGDFTAVDDVSFEIDKGEIFGFLGSNGCGKTTTMKMLTGLLPASEGQAWLFGTPVDARNLETRKRVGYMSQSFSLYGELSVRQNLELHAHLFHLEHDAIAERIGELLERFELTQIQHAISGGLPLGQRQRLSLAVAVIHRPEILILDEPTSGVDPVARDQFWEFLIELSRSEDVTIFISTHFTNEAERCDRISLMHAGKVLAVGPPEELRARRGAETMDEAFIGYLQDAVGNDGERGGGEAGEAKSSAPGVTDDASEAKAYRARPQSKAQPAGAGLFDTGRLWAFARREGMEILRDPIRLAFALLGPLVLMIAMGYGISFDVENLSYAVLDRDRTQESRQFIEQLNSSRYFDEQEPLNGQSDIGRRLQTGNLKIAIEIPPDYGKDLLAGRRPEIGVWLDGAMPFRAETARSYLQGVYQRYLEDLAREEIRTPTQPYPVELAVRFRYNQSFESENAITPGVLMVLLVLIPAMMTAVGVVREKELGSITNLYVTPATRAEFLLGKQLPYIVIAMISFFSLIVMLRLLFGVPITGNFAALMLGTLIYTTAATGFGLVMSCFMRTQIAAIFGTAIIAIIPAINFSGLLQPVSSHEGGARIMGLIFPAQYYQEISAGVISKGLGFAEVAGSYASLAVFCLVFWAISLALLRSQER